MVRYVMLEGSHPQEGLPPAHFGRRYNLDLDVFQGFSVQNMEFYSCFLFHIIPPNGTRGGGK